MLAAGLTLVFGIMSFINLAHGCLYMMGAYFAATAFQHTGSFGLAALAALAAMLDSLLLGPALTSLLTSVLAYMLMAVVLAWRPRSFSSEQGMTMTSLISRPNAWVLLLVLLLLTAVC